VAFTRTDVSEELSASFIRVIRIGELGTTLSRLQDIPSVGPSSPILVTLMVEALSSSETSVLTKATLTSQKTTLFVRFLVFTAVTMKIAVYWDATPYDFLQEPHGVTSQNTTFFIVIQP
jgi:hypothetical protein